MTTASSSRSTRSSRTQRSGQAKRSSGSKQSTQQRGTSTRRTQSEAQAETGDRGATVHLPFVTAEFHRPEMRLPTGQDLESTVRNVQAQLPSRQQALFYGALSVGAAFAVIDWPVAVAIGVGSAIAQRESGQ